MKKGKILALLGMAVIGVGFFAVKLQMSRAYSGLDQPINVNDNRFFYKAGGSYTKEMLYPPYPASTWGWASYEENKTEAEKHQNMVVFYKYNNPQYGDYYMTTNMGADYTLYGGVMSNAVVHCPAGATVLGPHNPHMGNLGQAGMYDGSGHYWCSQNGVGVNPLPGPESGKGMPDTYSSTQLIKNQTKTVNGVIYYKFNYNGGVKLQQMYTDPVSNGYVKCKYAMSGPFTGGDYSNEHYHCLSPDGSRQADVDFNGEDIFIPSPAAIPVCTLTLNDNKTSYTAEQNTFVNYTYTCTPPASSVAVQVIKPDGTATTYNTSTGDVSTNTMGFETRNLTPGNYTLRICVNDTTCQPASLVSVPFTITAATSSAAVSGAGCSPSSGSYGCGADGNSQFYCSPSTNKWQFSQYCSTSNRTCNASTGMCKPICGDAICGIYETAADCPGYSDCPVSTAACNKLGIVLNRGTNNSNVYPKGENVNYTVSCETPAGSPAANATIKLFKPDNTSTTLLTISNSSVLSHGYGFPTNDFVDGTYMLKACLDSACTSTSTGLVSFIIASSGFVTPTGNSTCTGMNLSTNKTSYAGEEVVLNYSCASPANGTLTSMSIQVMPPNSTSVSAVATINPPTGSAYIALPNSYVIPASYFNSGSGSYLIRTCMNAYCTSSSLNSVSINYTAGAATTTSSTIGAGAPEPTNDEAGVWAQVDVSTGQILTTAICKRSVCGINGEYHGYVPPPTYPTGSTWWPTSKRYIWQVPGQAGYSSGTFNFNTYIFTVPGGTIYNGVFTSTTTVPTTTATTTSPVNTPNGPRACTAGEKCPSGSWCQNGSQCYYPDGQLTCVAWSSNTAASASTTAVECPSGTSPCSPNDMNCVAPGQTVPYAASKWCMQSQQYYSSNGLNMTCVKMGESPPAGYSNCRPDDMSCIPEGSYGSSNGWCSRGMKCYQTATDTNSKNDVYCPMMPAGAISYESATCPAGYSVCSPTEVSCKQKGDSWSEVNNSYYCSGSQKCTLSNGGGTCVGMNEMCPAGTKYCSSTDMNCVEPDSYKTITSTASSFWCTGGGMQFYSATQIYCPPKKVPVAGQMMWTGPEIKAVLAKLGSGWKLCRPDDRNCIEPGQSGPASGWCMWMPSGYAQSSSSSNGMTRTCPALDETATTIQGPINGAQPSLPVSTPLPFESRECAEGEIAGPNNPCVMPMYRWNINSKTFEKCDNAAKNASYTSVKDTANAKYTNCEPMNVAFEKEWKTERYTVRPPEVYGEWYMPPWDPATKQLQYDPVADQFGSCNRSPSVQTPVPAAVTYSAPCMPVPEMDKGWMLKKARAEYKMFNVYSSQYGTVSAIGVPVGEIPSAVFPTVVPATLPVAISSMPAAQCKPYLLGVRQGLNGDKQFWKSTRVQLSQVPKNYPDLATISALLDESKNVMNEIDRLTKRSTCSQETLSVLQEKQEKLHAELFPEISSYISDIQDFVQFGYCKNDLKNILKKLNSISKNGAEGEVQTEVDSLSASIESKLKKFESQAGTADYEAAFDCQEFKNEVESQIAPLLRQTDKEINRIIDDVVASKLAPVIDDLKKQVEERGKKIDELLVQVAELHQAVANITQSANQISERIAVSYSALSRIGEEFKDQKEKMQSSKERLMALVEKAAKTMQDVKCVKSVSDKDRLLAEFGNAAAVNWIGEGSDEMEKRINLFITSCAAKAIASSDITSFAKSADDLEKQNLQNSYAQGLTPFADVPTHEWYYGAMLTVSKSGAMTQGRPAENVLRQDALLMIMRASGATDADLKGDCRLEAPSVTNVSPYAVCAANSAQDRGLALRGSLTVPVSRAEIAQWISKLANLTPPSADETVLAPYKDLRGVAEDEKLAILTMIANKIMVGNVSGNSASFTPRDPLTRAALAVILEKLMTESEAALPQ